MATPFNRLARTLLAPAVSGFMGEPFRLFPRAASADVNAAPGPDVSRVEADFVGVFRAPAVMSDITRSYDMRTAHRPGVDALASRIDVMPGQIGPGLAIRKDDLIEQPASGRRWRVSHTVPTAAGILRCYLHDVG